MNFSNTCVYNFENAFKILNNYRKKYDVSDSFFGMIDEHFISENSEIADKWVEKYHSELNWPKEFSDEGCKLAEEYAEKIIKNGILRSNCSESEPETVDLAFLGPNDMALIQALKLNSNEYNNFLKQIIVSVKLTAPLYFWEELNIYDTIKVYSLESTLSLSMIENEPIKLENFEVDDLNENLIYYSLGPAYNDIGMLADFIIEQLEFLRKKYLETKDVNCLKELRRWLPSGWLKTQIITTDYYTLKNVYSNMLNNKFTKWIASLPYAKYLILNNEEVPFQIEK